MATSVETAACRPGRIRGVRGVRAAARGFVVAGLSWGVLIAAVGVGLRFPAEERLPPSAGAGPLDYSRLPGGLDPLREGFIASVLGLPPGRSGGAPLTGGRGLEAGGPFAAVGPLPRTTVTHPFNNDDFRSAYPVASIPFTGKTDTHAASRQSGEPAASCEPLGGTVWYRYRPTGEDAGLIANTFDSTYATAVAVFIGADIGHLEEVACDVDTAGNAQVVFPGKKDVTYYFQVVGPAGGGDLVFSLDPLGKTERVSVSSTGREANSESGVATVSADGRYVAFMSSADNLVENVDENENACFYGNCFDVFVHDRATGVTELVSVSSAEKQGNGFSGPPTISGDGRYVAFWSGASNLVPGDRNGAGDVFVRDRLTGTTERVSVSWSGKEGKAAVPYEEDQGPAYVPSVSISSDGRYVAFASHLEGLVPHDENACVDATTYTGAGFLSNYPLPGTPVPGPAVLFPCRDIFVRDRVKHTTERVSASSDGVESNGDSSSAFISSNGRYVAFASDADNLVAHDDNRYRDVFVHDRATGVTELVSLSSKGRQAHGQSGGIGVRGHATISDDGRYVAFISNAPDLVEDDTNAPSDVFLRDRAKRTTIWVSRTAASPGGIRKWEGSHASISRDGRYVAFTHLEPRPNRSDLNEIQEIFLYDRLTATTTRVSVPTSGEEANGLFMHEPEISADGHFVVFHSNASNLSGDDDRDTNDQTDVFIHELPWTG